MKHFVIDTGGRRSFAEPHALLENQAASAEAADVIVIIGRGAGAALAGLMSGPATTSEKAAVLIELEGDCLGEHTGESGGNEGSNVLGFARFRLGDSAPSRLVELVRQPATPDAAIAAARSVLEAADLVVSVCLDFQGRIVDRLVRPYYNAALRRLDEGLATAADLDLTLRLGLGYPEGPIALLEKSGLAHHYDVSQNLFERLGDAAYAPARRAQVAKRRGAGR